MAEPEWKRTIEIDPNHADARAFYSHYLSLRSEPRFQSLLRRMNLPR